MGSAGEWGQDIKMDRIVDMAREYQPGLIVVDRWVGGSTRTTVPGTEDSRKAVGVPVGNVYDDGRSMVVFAG